MSSRPTFDIGQMPSEPTPADEKVIDKYGEFEYPTPSDSGSDDPWAADDPWNQSEDDGSLGGFWERWVEDYVETELRTAAKNLGIDYSDQLKPYVDSWMPEALGHVRTNWANHLQTIGPFPNLEDPVPVLDGKTEAALDTLGLAALNWMKENEPEIAEMWRYGKSDPFNPNRNGSPSGGRRGGGGGRAGPTLSAADFDADYISEQIQKLWQAYLLDDHSDPRSLANAYINARVSNPESPLELETFVLNRIRNTGRYKSIYRSKPEGVDELAFMNRYLSVARQYLSEEVAQDVAIGGAQFRASPGSFQERISREREVQTTAPFIAGLEQMMSEVRGVLRG